MGQFSQTFWKKVFAGMAEWFNAELFSKKLAKTANAELFSKKLVKTAPPCWGVAPFFGKERLAAKDFLQGWRSGLTRQPREAQVE